MARAGCDQPRLEREPTGAATIAVSSKSADGPRQRAQQRRSGRDRRAD